MKKIFAYLLCFTVFLLISCRDESLNPVPVWESGVHALGVFADIPEGKQGTNDKANFADNGRNFPLTGQDNSKIDFRIRWVSLDNKLTVNKIEIYVDMTESYTDADGNPKTVSLSGGTGKLVKTITPAAANREWNAFSLTPVEIYNLYKDATVKYDKVKDVKVFENPARPRPAGNRLQGSQTNPTTKKVVANADAFKITWRLTTTDGLVFKTWEPGSICQDPTPVSQANSNCELEFIVK